jgi:hypothetical protein
MSALMPARIRQVFRRDAQPVLWTPVDQQGEPLEPQKGYFRVWLSDMFLARNRDWFTNRYPAVHASVCLRFGGDEQATFTTVARPPQDLLGPGVFQNFALTPLLPYRGGTVELSAGLTVLKGASTLAAGLDVLRDFSTLIGPPLSQTLGVATKVTSGMTKLIDAAQDQVALSLSNAFVATGGSDTNNVLLPGYWAIVRTTEDRVSPASLRVHSGRLHTIRNDSVHPLLGYDYMLLYIEGRVERDDWRFANFEDLINKAKRAHFAEDNRSFAVYRNAVLAEVLSSPDLTWTDQQRVVRAIIAELDATFSAPLAITGEALPDLAVIVAQHAPSVEDILDTQPLTLEQLLSSAPPA